MDEIAAELGLAWVSDHPQELLGTLTGFDSRMAGSDGEARAAAAVADSFREAGVRDVRRESFPMDAWERGDSSLVASAPERRAFETVALPYSPAGEVAGPLVDVGYGTPEEIEAAELDGRIALASTTTPPGGRFVHRMEKFGTASDAGAVGFVFVNHLPGQLPPTGSLTFGGEASIPAVGVSHETGERLRQHAIDGGGVAVDAGGAATGVSESVTGAEGQPPDAELSVTAATQSGESHNVVGHLGPETEERLLAVAHYDAHDIAEGALDNGCGVAVLATAARVLAAADLDRRVTVAAVGAEEVGLLGAEHLAETVDLDSVVGVCNVDGAGRFRDLVAMAHTRGRTAGS